MGSDDLTWTPLGGDIEVTYLSPTGPTTETLFGASAFEVPGGGTTTTGAVVIVLDDGSVCTLTDLTSPFRSATLADLKTLTDGRNHTVHITDNGVEAGARKAAAALAETHVDEFSTVSTVKGLGSRSKAGGSKKVPGSFGIDPDSGNPIMVFLGPPTHPGYESLVDKVKVAAASIHQENGGPPVTVAVSQHGGSTKEPTRGTAYTCFTFDVAPRAHWCVYARYGDWMPPPRKKKESKPGHVVVGENLATGLEEAMKRVRGWIASTMCRAVGARALPLMTKFEQKPDLRGIVWSEPGDTVTFLGSAGEKTFTVSDRARVRGVAVAGLDDPGLDDPGLDDPSIGGPGFNGPDPYEQLDRAEEHLAIASLALDAATKEGQEDLAPLIEKVKKAKEEKEAAYQRAREAARSAGIEEHRATKKRPADDDNNDDDGAVAPMLEGGGKRKRPCGPGIGGHGLDDPGIGGQGPRFANGDLSLASTIRDIDGAINDIQTVAIPDIEASIALLKGLIGTTPSDTVNSFYTINGNSPVDMIAIRREKLSELDDIIVGLEGNKRELEMIEREERELRRRYEELCRRGREEASEAAAPPAKRPRGAGHVGSASHSNIASAAGAKKRQKKKPASKLTKDNTVVLLPGTGADSAALLTEATEHVLTEATEHVPTKKKGAGMYLLVLSNLDAVGQALKTAGPVRRAAVQELVHLRVARNAELPASFLPDADTVPYRGPSSEAREPVEGDTHVPVVDTYDTGFKIKFWENDDPNHVRPSGRPVSSTVPTLTITTKETVEARFLDKIRFAKVFHARGLL